MNRPGLIPRPAKALGYLVRGAALALAAGLAGLAPIAVRAAPAERVADIHPGPATGGIDNWLWDGDFEPYAGRVFFSADDGIHGNELWATDGTLAGTVLVADICPGVCSSNPYT